MARALHRGADPLDRRPTTGTDPQDLATLSKASPAASVARLANALVAAPRARDVQLVCPRDHEREERKAGAPLRGKGVVDVTFEMFTPTRGKPRGRRRWTWHGAPIRGSRPIPCPWVTARPSARQAQARDLDARRTTGPTTSRCRRDASSGTTPPHVHGRRPGRPRCSTAPCGRRRHRGGRSSQRSRCRGRSCARDHLDMGGASAVRRALTRGDLGRAGERRTTLADTTEPPPFRASGSPRPSFSEPRSGGPRPTLSMISSP